MLDNLPKLAQCEMKQIQEERKPTLFPAETEVEKAKKRLSAGVKGVGKSGRFLKVKPDGVSLNEEAIAQDERFDGLHGVWTSLEEMKPAQVYAHYGELRKAFGS